MKKMRAITAPLIAFAYLAETAHESGHNLDLIAALAPILGSISSSLDGKPFSAALLARELRANFGLRVNPYAVEQWIPQLKAAAIIRADPLDRPRGKRQVEVLTFSTPPAGGVPIEEDDIDEIIRKFVDYATLKLGRLGVQITELELEAIFLKEIANLDFLAAIFGSNKQPSEKSGTHPTSSTEGKISSTESLAAAEHDVLVASFFLHTSETDPKSFDKIVKISSGAVISEVLFDVGNPQTGTSFEKQTLILDGPLCIKALGLNSKEDETHSLDLLNTMIQRGAKINVFDHTLIEIRRVLEAALKGAQEDWGYGPTVRRIRADRNAEVMARSVLGDMEGALSAIGVTTILKNPTTSAAWARLSEPKQRQLAESLSWYESVDARDRDATSLCATYRLRAGITVSPKKVHEARYLFVTENSRLVDVSYSFFSAEPDAPITVTEKYLAGYLFVMCGGADDISGTLRKKVLANCTNAVAPRTDLIKRMAYFVDKLDENQRNKYTAMMTDSRAGRYLTEVTLGNSGYLHEGNFEKVLNEIYDEAFIERERYLSEQKSALLAEYKNDIKRISDGHQLAVDVEKNARREATDAIEARVTLLTETVEKLSARQDEFIEAKLQLHTAIKQCGTDAHNYGNKIAFALYGAYGTLAAFIAYLGDVLAPISDFRYTYYLASGFMVLIALNQIPSYLIDLPRSKLAQRKFRLLLIKRGLTPAATEVTYDPKLGKVLFLERKEGI